MHFSAAEQLVQTSIAKVEIARTARMDAQSQLLNVKTQKEEADAKASVDAATAHATKDLPDNAKSLTKVKDLVCLLPNTMAGEFGQCLALLESILEKANTASQAATQDIPDSDSEMASSEVAPDGHGSPMHTFMSVPLFPGGEERLHSQEECRKATGVPSDPYMATEGARTPPRGRAKSADPGRSPHTRTAAASSGMESPPPPSPNVAEGGIGFFLADNVAAPFHA